MPHPANYGRNGDTLVAHINPWEAALLKSLGGAGTVNPVTGFLEFFGAEDVQRIYQDKLGRAATQSDIDFQLGAIRDGLIKADQLAGAVANSAEARDRVSGYYTDILGRSAVDTDLAFQQDALATGKITMSGMRDAFFGVPEYETRARTQAGDEFRENLVRTGNDTELGRFADYGRTNKVGLGGNTFQDYVQGQIQKTDEFGRVQKQFDPFNEGNYITANQAAFDKFWADNQAAFDGNRDAASRWMFADAVRNRRVENIGTSAPGNFNVNAYLKANGLEGSLAASGMTPDQMNQYAWAHYVYSGAGDQPSAFAPQPSTGTSGAGFAPTNPNQVTPGAIPDILTAPGISGTFGQALVNQVQRQSAPSRRWRINPLTGALEWGGGASGTVSGSRRGFGATMMV